MHEAATTMMKCGSSWRKALKLMKSKGELIGRVHLKGHLLFNDLDSLYDHNVFEVKQLSVSFQL